MKMVLKMVSGLNMMKKDGYKEPQLIKMENLLKELIILKIIALHLNN